MWCVPDLPANSADKNNSNPRETVNINCALSEYWASVGGWKRPWVQEDTIHSVH